jgi:hypothetical protein
MENAGHTYYLETEKDAVSLTAQAIADEINALTLCSE